MNEGWQRFEPGCNLGPFIFNADGSIKIGERGPTLSRGATVINCRCGDAVLNTNQEGVLSIQAPNTLHEVRFDADLLCWWYRRDGGAVTEKKRGGLFARIFG